METDIKRLIKSFNSGDRRVKLIAAAAALGVLLILISEFIPQQSAKVKSVKDDGLYAEYIASLEERTQKLVSSIDGAGRCKVMITLKTDGESVFAKNFQENQSDSSYSKNDEYVFYEGESGKSPVRIKQYFPAVQGVAVVCDGADKTEVRESIINSISSLYGVSVSKISVSKYKG